MAEMDRNGVVIGGSGARREVVYVLWGQVGG